MTHPRKAILSGPEERLTEISLPPYYREASEHIEVANHELQWIPFPTCNETGSSLEFHYDVETELNCTISLISDTFVHLLELYIHADAPLACRLPAWPPAHVETIGEAPPKQEYIRLVFALAGTPQFSRLEPSHLARLRLGFMASMLTTNNIDDVFGFHPEMTRLIILPRTASIESFA